MSLMLARQCVIAAREDACSFDFDLVPHLSKFVLRHGDDVFAEVAVDRRGNIKVAHDESEIVFPFSSGSIEGVPKYLAKIADEHFWSGI